MTLPVMSPLKQLVLVLLGKKEKIPVLRPKPRKSKVTFYY